MGRLFSRLGWQVAVGEAEVMWKMATVGLSVGVIMLAGQFAQLKWMNPSPTAWVLWQRSKDHNTISWTIWKPFPITGHACVRKITGTITM